PDSALAYVPSLAGNTIICSFYAAFTVIAAYLTIRHRAWWAICLPTGTFFSALGFALRIVLRSPANQGDKAIFIPQYLFVVLPPACFLGFAYIVGGRLLVAVTAMDGGAVTKPGMEPLCSTPADNGHSRNVSLEPTDTRQPPLSQRSPFAILPPRLYTFIFVMSDIVTFVVQAVGASLQTSDDYDTVLTGSHIYLAGAAAQMASFFLFALIMIHSHCKLYLVDPESYSFKRAFVKRNPGSVLFVTLHAVGICILLRCAFRTAEMALGVRSHLYNTEIYTFLLDALPLLIVVAFFLVVWPKKYLDRV
ncbi:hypothetical protein BCV69DRAFT_240173, partial [Microstroma glucosiphilum]